MIDFKETLRINMLLDFYQTLLTKKQLDYMQLYFKKNLSLQEIGNLYDISRNAVYDNIKRAIKQLEDYEFKLQLLDKYTKKQVIIDKMKHQYASNKALMHDIEQLEDLE